MDSQKILEEAIASYAQMPFETKELYKKYTLSMQIPDGAAAPNGELENLGKEIIAESRLRFNLTNDKNGITSKNEFVKVTKKARKEYKQDAKDGFEKMFGNYITRAAEQTIEVNVPAGKEAKLNFLLLSDNANLPLEIVINVEENAKLDLFEWFGSASTSSSMMAPFHVVNAARKAKVEVNILHNENANTSVGALNKVTAAEESTVRFNGIYNGGSATKSITFAEAAGRQSDLLANEIVFGHAEQKFDIGSFLLNSNEFTKAVLKSGAVLKGKSFCILKGYAKVASRTKGSYSNVEEKGLVMDPDARIQPLPDMSIDCNEVAFASHSAATAPVDKEALFYLMSRGIDDAKAKRIFVASFLSKYLANIENDIVKEIAISILLDKLDNDKHASVPKISMQNLWIVPGKK